MSYVLSMGYSSDERFKKDWGFLGMKVHEQRIVGTWTKELSVKTIKNLK